MRLEDGFPTLVQFQLAPGVFGTQMWIKRVKMPGFDGGGGIPDSTMHNSAMRTMYPKSLASVTDGSIVVSYDLIALLTFFNTLMQQIGSITFTVADGQRFRVYGWADGWEPSEHSEGVQPEATIKIIASNQTTELAEVVPSLA